MPEGRAPSFLSEVPGIEGLREILVGGRGGPVGDQPAAHLTSPILQAALPLGSLEVRAYCATGRQSVPSRRMR